MFVRPHWNVPALNTQYSTQIQAIIDNKTKPIGSLGVLEKLALQLASVQLPITANVQKLTITDPVLLIFAADHGIATRGISIAPPEVTQQMVTNFLDGGAAINCFCRLHDMSLNVIDAGMLARVESTEPMYFERRLGAGTADISQENAMTLHQLKDGLEYGAQIVKAHVPKQSNLVGFGEMGIGNTTSAAALLSALLNCPADKIVGRGTGINNAQFALKVDLVEQAIYRTNKARNNNIPLPYYLLASLGGFEIVQMIGAMLASAELQKLIVIDGFIVSVAALYACNIAPQVRDYMIFSHIGAERSHALVLEKLQAEPLLDLGLRLGEGTGAALSLPLIRSAAAFFNEMATFESAHVSV